MFYIIFENNKQLNVPLFHLPRRTYLLVAISQKSDHSCA